MDPHLDSGGEDYFTHEAGGAYDFRRDPSPNCGPGCSQVNWEDQNVYSTTVFSREACSIIAKHPFATPLFLYLAYQVSADPRSRSPRAAGAGVKQPRCVCAHERSDFGSGLY